MRQTAHILSTYSADTFGVCSALFELGGMVIMHDASGCNSTYTTHDEPRWYDMDSLLYITGLSEIEAIMGDDDKLIRDIVDAANGLHPKFIALCGTPIPTMIGTDFAAVAKVIENRTGIPAIGIPTTGMNPYTHGIDMALTMLSERFVQAAEVIPHTANILGLTPLDFSTNGQDAAIAKAVEEQGYTVLSRWAMGSSLEELSQAAAAEMNFVCSSAALNLKIHEKTFIWLGSKTLSDKAGRAERIMNYPGLPGVTGAELNAAFLAHLEAMGIEITEAMVSAVYPMGDHFALAAGADFYEARTLLLATGAKQA